MKRWRLLVLLLIVIVAIGYTVHRVFAKRAEQKSEAAYSTTLRSYTDVLKPGMTRKQVEAYLADRGIHWSGLCCDDSGAYHDAVLIATEKPTWNCANIRIYVALRFAAPEKRKLTTADDTDVLQRIELQRGSICWI